MDTQIGVLVLVGLSNWGNLFVTSFKGATNLHFTCEPSWKGPKKISADWGYSMVFHLQGLSQLSQDPLDTRWYSKVFLGPNHWWALQMWPLSCQNGLVLRPCGRWKSDTTRSWSWGSSWLLEFNLNRKRSRTSFLTQRILPPGLIIR